MLGLEVAAVLLCRNAVVINGAVVRGKKAGERARVVKAERESIAEAIGTYRV